MVKKNYQNNGSLVELLKQAEKELRQFLKIFDSTELADKFPDKSRRLNVTSSIEPERILRVSMQRRVNFIKSALDLFFVDSGKKIGIDKALIDCASEILSQN